MFTEWELISNNMEEVTLEYIFPNVSAATSNQVQYAMVILRNRNGEIPEYDGFVTKYTKPDRFLSGDKTPL
jgi:hypothetical protein